jgi:hypothetical protein
MSVKSRFDADDSQIVSDVATKMPNLGVEISVNTSAEFSEVISGDIARMRQVLEKAGDLGEP